MQYTLTRPEAQLVADFLRQVKKIDLPNGWVAVWKLTPETVAKRYHVSVDEVLKAARRVVEE